MLPPFEVQVPSPGGAMLPGSGAGTCVVRNSGAPGGPQRLQADVLTVRALRTDTKNWLFHGGARTQVKSSRTKWAGFRL